jgi:hypothetical protein
MDIPSTRRWYVVFLGARFQTRKATVDDPRIDANAVNLGAIATAFCWARVDMVMVSYRGIGAVYRVQCSGLSVPDDQWNGEATTSNDTIYFFCTKLIFLLPSLFGRSIPYLPTDVPLSPSSSFL